MAEVQFFRDGYEVAQMPKLDVLIHISIVLIPANNILDVLIATGYIGTNTAMNIEFRTFQPGDETAFRQLNEVWIEKYFSMEAPDREVLNKPFERIVQPGGQIVMAMRDGDAVGCCALISMESGVFELGKMTVREDHRGLGVGRRLLKATIDTAARMGATRLYLESNDRLADAVHLYESLGFRHLPPERVHASPYARSNVHMELDLAT
jgi:putative acetyltransferase